VQPDVKRIGPESDLSRLEESLSQRYHAGAGGGIDVRSKVMINNALVRGVTSEIDKRFFWSRLIQFLDTHKGKG
jgi:hypothetical protein